ncbi:VWA domain-containing protein [Nocardia carnea]|uniref:VWA domain-containing protein n=1 Tax=Nocardia carnea TaxID=37328 RepID=A0ABW7TQ20_9NOCA|nr:VWA domain-containing protein [Nocardia carnea]
MTTQLLEGQNDPLDLDDLTISLDIAAAADLAALLVTNAGTVRSDADFVFFNAPSGPGTRLRPGLGGQPGVLEISLSAIPADIAQVRVVVALDSPDTVFGRLPAPTTTVSDTAGNSLYTYRMADLGAETVVVAVEIYRRSGSWKIRAVGRGYAGGLAELVTAHGITVADEPSASPPPDRTENTPPSHVDGDIRTARGEEKLSLEKRAKLDLRKREVVKVLLEKGVRSVRARVVLVIDKTGSMRRLYSTGTVQRVVERMIPVAIQLDDDGRIEPYLYAADYAKLPDITVDRTDEWSTEYLHLRGRHGGIDYAEIGGTNNELPIMREIIASLNRHSDPTLVLFFTDGGFRERAKISALLRKASELPAFWQFIGLGRADYGLLQNLDTMTGRQVDNTGFFSVDDIDILTDADLYDRLLGEFPDWLRAARSAGIAPRHPASTEVTTSLGQDSS